MDLEGGRHVTRNKTDLSSRETELAFLFRALDAERWESAMGVDFTLQTEKYRSMIVEEAKTRVELRNPTFSSCGIYDRVYNLKLFTDPVKLKLFLTGNVLTEDNATITLSDFVGKQMLTVGDIICAENNAPMVIVLQNIQIVLRVLLSNEFSEVMETFINDLQGTLRPLELVKANLLTYTVEGVIRKFFKVVRSERTGSSPVIIKVKNPNECATYLQSLFHQLKDKLADHQTRGVEESYYNLRAGQNVSISRATFSITATSIKQEPGIKKKQSSRPCTGFTGGQVKVKSKDGSPYKCAHGKVRTFRHVNLKDLSEEEVSELVAKLPDIAQADCRKALKKSSGLLTSTGK